MNENVQNAIELGRALVLNKVPSEYADGSKNEGTLRKALLDLNGGSQYVSLKSFRRNPEFFEVIEVMIPQMITEGLKGDEFFTNLVEYRNLAHGDDFEFTLKTEADYTVADASYGNGGIRRQRLTNGAKVTVETKLKVIALFDDIERFLAGKIDLQELVQACAKAMKKRIMEDVYNSFKGITENTAGLAPEYFGTGTYVEDELLETIAHIEADSDTTVTIFGTVKALRKLKVTDVANSGKEDMYNLGYYGKFNSYTCVKIKQEHKAGTKEFLFQDDEIYLMTSDGDKPIKVCDKGEAIMDTDLGLKNAEHSQNVFYGQEYGIAAIAAAPFGKYKVA